MPIQAQSRAIAVLSEALKVPTEQRIRLIQDAFPNDPKAWDELLEILDGFSKASDANSDWTGGTTFGQLVPDVAVVPGVPTSVLTIGASFGPYRVSRRLKPGGMGEVAVADDIRLPRRVVLKCLSGRWLAAPMARDRLLREARTAAALNHKNIATLYDVLDEHPQPLLVMEYVEGKSLQQILAEGPVPLGLALRYAIQLAEALGFAHDHGIIHCDVKPANVQITPEGVAKVLDFGLARAQFDSGDELSVSERGKIFGTPGYMAPERLTRGIFNAAGDIYALGVVLFELLTGAAPYSEQGHALMLAVLASDAPAPSVVVPGLSPALDAIVSRAMARDPRLRYRSAREFARDLDGALSAIEATPSLSDHFQRVAQPASLSPLMRRLLRGGAVVATIFAAVTLAGLATSTAYNIALGRTGMFGESPMTWPGWGLSALWAPMFLAVIYLLALTIPYIALRFLISISAPLRNWFAPVQRKLIGIRAWLDDQPTATLAQCVLVVQLMVLAFFWWQFNGLLDGLLSFTGHYGTHEQLARLGPWWDGAPNDRSLRQNLGWIFGLFCVATYSLVNRLTARRDHQGVYSIIAVVIVTVLTMGLLVLPFRILRQNTSERVWYDSERCYMVGQAGNDALLFCPLQPPPWRRVVRLNDPLLRREQTQGNIFEELERFRTEVQP